MDPRASLSSTSCEPLSHAGGAILCLLCCRELARRAIKFARPAAQRRVRSRVELKLVRLFFGTSPSPGTMVSKTGYPEPLAKRALASKRESEAIEGVTGAASGGVQKAFLAASVADSLPHTFQEASGFHVGSHIGRNINVVGSSSLVTRVLCLKLFFNRCCYAYPLKFDSFGRCEKKAHMACDP